MNEKTCATPAIEPVTPPLKAFCMAVLSTLLASSVSTPASKGGAWPPLTLSEGCCIGARCLWCLLNEGGAARAASSPSVERPTRARMSVRMVSRFVYVRVGGDLLEVPKAVARCSVRA